MPNELLALRDERERTIALLSDLFAGDQVDLDDFERRLTLAHRAASIAELHQLVADLPGRAPAAPATALVAAPAAGARERQSIVAVLAGANRRGQWSCPRHLRVATVLGGVQLDFRETRFAAGVTDVSVAAVLGGVEVIVPPGLAVELDGTAVLGGFDHLDRAPAQPDPDRPVVRIHGLAILGGVSVETRLPGEQPRDAHHRRRHERRALRHAARHGDRALRGATDEVVPALPPRETRTPEETPPPGGTGSPPEK